MQILKRSGSPEQSQTNSPHFLFFKATTKGKEAVGILSVADKSWPAISGPAGNGFLPAGKYKAVGFVDEQREAYCFIDDTNNRKIGFYIRLEPQFETTRFDLLIHFRGRFRGTFGCIEIETNSFEESKEIYEYLKKLMAEHKYLDLIVELSA